MTSYCTAHIITRGIYLTQNEHYTTFKLTHKLLKIHAKCNCWMHHIAIHHEKILKECSMKFQESGQICLSFTVAIE